MPFSVYFKPWQQPWIFDPDVLARLQPLFAIPLQGMDWREGISTMRDPQLTMELAAQVSTRIPDATDGTGKLLTDYWNSKLADFHTSFYSQEQHPAELWPETYDRLSFGKSAGLRPHSSRAAKRFPAATGIYSPIGQRNAGTRLASAPHRGIDLLEIRSRFRVDAVRQCRSLRRALISTRAFSPVSLRRARMISSISTALRPRNKARAHFQTADSI